MHDTTFNQLATNMNESPVGTQPQTYERSDDLLAILYTDLILISSPGQFSVFYHPHSDPGAGATLRFLGPEFLFDPPRKPRAVRKSHLPYCPHSNIHRHVHLDSYHRLFLSSAVTQRHW